MQNLIIIFFSILFWAGSSVKQSNEKPWSETLNTAKDAVYLDDLEQNVILELNKVRSNPKRFAEDYLVKLRSAYNGKLFQWDDQVPIRTQEGIQPLDECIQVLMKTDSRSILLPVEGLAKAARELVNDQQKYGGIGHISRKGANPQNRMGKYGEWDICSSEDITYGSSEARQIVISLLIDDGVPNRGHRENILNPCSRFVGVSKGGHPTYGTMCVIDYAGDYKNK